jgi:Chagasin family peptidase inhibitor I42
MVILLRSTAVLLLSFLAATSSSAQSACSVTLNVGEQGNVTAKRGYSWQVQDGGDAMTLQPTSTFERNGPQPGASGVMRFTMKAATPGDYTLVLMLVPPGNTGAEAGRAFFGLKVL